MRDYNAAFVRALRRTMDGSDGELSLRRRSAELAGKGEMERLFPGRDVLWLQKELSKWRSRLREEEPTFNGTLRSLQIYCTLMGVTPNDVLLPAGSGAERSRVEFLSRETIVALAAEIRRSAAVLPQGFAIPVLYAPERMTAVFLFLFPQRRGGKDSVVMRFGISEAEGYAEEDDGVGGISTALDSSLHATDLSLADWEERLRAAYGKIRGEFDAVCAASERPMEETVRELYALSGNWAMEGAKTEDALFFRYPPRKRKTERRSTLDDLSGLERMISVESGRER